MGWRRAADSGCSPCPSISGPRACIRKNQVWRAPLAQQKSFWQGGCAQACSRLGFTITKTTNSPQASASTHWILASMGLGNSHSSAASGVLEPIWEYSSQHWVPAVWFSRSSPMRKSGDIDHGAGAGPGGGGGGRGSGGG